MLRLSRRWLSVFATAAIAATVLTPSVAAAQVPLCDGKVVTMQVPVGGAPFSGTDGDDVILGTEGPDIIRGRKGNDTICGLGGNDQLFGDGGRDKLLGNRGDDSLFGGWGNDRLLGGLGHDRIVGGPNHDRLFGFVGFDVLEGRDGNDVLYGGPGADQLFGGNHNDKLFGGDGTNDRCFGGSGTDVFTNACETRTQGNPPPGATPTVTPTPPGNLGTAGCGSPTQVGRLQRRSLQSDGIQREVWAYVPNSYARNAATPMILVLHGYRGDGTSILDWTEMIPRAEQHGYLLVAPSSLSLTNDPQGYTGWELDERTEPGYSDVRFVDAALDLIEARFCVDTTRVYAMGNSNGGFFASRLVCERSHRFAAAAAVTGLMWDRGCPPEAQIPMFGMHGTADGVVPLLGGPSHLPGNIFFPGLFSRSIPAAFAEFAAHNGCNPEPVEQALTSDIRRFTYQSCAAESIFHVVDGGGHTWPGSAVSASASSIRPWYFGPTSTTMHASDAIVEFFQRHARPELATFRGATAQFGTAADGEVEYVDLPLPQGLRFDPSTFAGS